ncbi:hypothetical protein VKT23_000131 [Stygiomarasmius scandens]|uniref:Uncharacterized protein n=1 Tax=Marasmiellus scandens TaxID=2682957 RepID=A0ABR1K776_9AGAR
MLQSCHFFFCYFLTYFPRAGGTRQSRKLFFLFLLYSSWVTSSLAIALFSSASADLPVALPELQPKTVSSETLSSGLFDSASTTTITITTTTFTEPTTETSPSFPSPASGNDSESSLLASQEFSTTTSTRFHTLTVLVVIAPTDLSNIPSSSLSSGLSATPRVIIPVLSHLSHGIHSSTIIFPPIIPPSSHGSDSSTASPTSTSGKYDEYNQGKEDPSTSSHGHWPGLNHTEKIVILVSIAAVFILGFLLWLFFFRKRRILTPKRLDALHRKLGKVGLGWMFRGSSERGSSWSSSTHRSQRSIMTFGFGNVDGFQYLNETYNDNRSSSNSQGSGSMPDDTRRERSWSGGHLSASTLGFGSWKSHMRRTEEEKKARDRLHTESVIEEGESWLTFSVFSEVPRAHEDSPKTLSNTRW